MPDPRPTADDPLIISGAEAAGGLRNGPTVVGGPVGPCQNGILNLLRLLAMPRINPLQLFPNDCCSQRELIEQLLEELAEASPTSQYAIELRRNATQCIGVGGTRIAFDTTVFRHGFNAPTSSGCPAGCQVEIPKSGMYLATANLSFNTQAGAMRTISISVDECCAYVNIGQYLNRTAGCTFHLGGALSASALHFFQAGDAVSVLADTEGGTATACEVRLSLVLVAPGCDV